MLPLPNWDGGADGSPKGWLYEVDSSATGTNRFKVNTGLALAGAAKSENLFLSDGQESRRNAVFGQPRERTWRRPQQISSYAMNGAVVGFGDIQTPVKLAAMKSTDCAFWETDETDPFYFNDGANFPAEGVSARHNQGAIQAEFDTSVSYVLLKDWYNDVDDPGKNRLWCYPNSPDGRKP